MSSPNFGKSSSDSGPSRKNTLTSDWSNVITSDAASTSRVISRIFSDISQGNLLRPSEYVLTLLPKISFITNSEYSGVWDFVGMTEYGNYSICTPGKKVEYEGELRDGMFHGEGTLTYPMGQKIDGEWVKGKLVSFKFRFADDLEYDTPWKYCKMPDRRFYTSIQDGMRPAGRSLLTNQDPPRKIPDGCYDTGDGFYNPKTKCVTSAIHPEKILRIPTAAEEKWIMENCRKAWDEPTGYRPDLFEHWVSGRKTDSALVSEDGSKSSSSSSSENSPVDDVYNISESDSSYKWWKQNFGSADKIITVVNNE